ncbi:biliverdin-producing heme oxygenase [Blastococcus goldschmidtiae]|uniref:Biliverdin-producing heme oxygenase n=1 Tax=Blastococcus goldschmidtiae TaxID=3075546 RepID=A0ABU2K843_9ACTN|nr:biliverdin-producing heme oxygenase [Blastococcus sp. DSM 46792]MDT0276343.1 biliverdin-producing heme oxygenase [Blastococcus sp. DSM 46792]
MAAGDHAALRDDRGTDEDVLRLLRVGTAAEHEDVERTLDLLDPSLSRHRLAQVLDAMHGFWRAAEAGLDEWAVRCPADAERVDWPRRRRASLFAADLRGLGSRASDRFPLLPPVPGTDEALGRMYVLEGSTLGGVFIDRHLAGLPELAGVPIRAFSPYGSETGAMWAAFRRVTRARVAEGGDAGAMLGAARTTFAALAGWCRPAAMTGLPA